MAIIGIDAALQILGLSRTTSKDELNKTFRALAKKYHPDRNDSTQAQRMFIDVQKAHAIILSVMEAAGSQTIPEDTPATENATTPTAIDDYEFQSIYTTYLKNRSSRNSVFASASKNPFGTAGTAGYRPFWERGVEPTSDNDDSTFYDESSQKTIPIKGTDITISLHLEANHIYQKFHKLEFKRTVKCKVCQHNYKCQVCLNEPSLRQFCKHCKTLGLHVPKASSIASQSREAALPLCKLCNNVFTFVQNMSQNVLVNQPTQTFSGLGNEQLDSDFAGDLIVNIELIFANPNVKFPTITVEKLPNGQLFPVELIRKAGDLELHISIDLYQFIYGFTYTYKSHTNQTMNISFQPPFNVQTWKILKNLGLPKDTTFKANGNLFVLIVLVLPAKEALQEKREAIKQLLSTT